VFRVFFSREITGLSVERGKTAEKYTKYTRKIQEGKDKTMQTQVNGRELVEKFWQEKMQAHPKFYARLNITKGILDFFFGGHVIPWALYKALMFSSRVADGVLMAAALWITAINVAPQFMTGLVGGADSASNLSSLSLLAFSLLPELITVAALVLTIKHIITFCKRRVWNNPAWAWATLYAIPTLTFLSMTIWTISSFVSHDGAAHITGGLLVTRCLAAWGYSFVEILFFELGRQSMVEADEKAKLRKENEDLRNTHAEEMQKLTADLEQHSADFRSQYAALSAELDAERMRNQFAEKARTSAPAPADHPQPAQQKSAPKSADQTRKKPAEKEPQDDAKVLEIGAKGAAIKKRNAKILELKAENSALSNREIAAQVGCDEKTVRLFLRKKDAEFPQNSGEYSAVNQ
jgi:hypothetical protein